MDVYLLAHVHDLDGVKEEKIIGIYSSSKMAEEAKERAKILPGFRDAPHGFHVDLYRIDVDHWTEGYVTVK